MSTIEIMTPFRSYTDKQIVVNVHSVMGSAVLEELIQTHPVSMDGKNGNIRSFVNIDLVNIDLSADGMNIKVQSYEALVITLSIIEGV